MKLHANIKGRPIPKVTWAKMNTNIKDRQGIIIKVTDNDTLVVVDKVNRYDAGKYVLNLDSVSGMKMYTITVKVIGKFSCDHGYLKYLKTNEKYSFTALFLTMQIPLAHH